MFRPQRHTHQTTPPKERHRHACFEDARVHCVVLNVRSVPPPRTTRPVTAGQKTTPTPTEHQTSPSDPHPEQGLGLQNPIMCTCETLTHSPTRSNPDPRTDPGVLAQASKSKLALSNVPPMSGMQKTFASGHAILQPG